MELDNGSIAYSDVQEVFLEWSRNNNLVDIQKYLDSSKSKGKILNYRGISHSYGLTKKAFYNKRTHIILAKAWKSAIMAGRHCT